MHIWAVIVVVLFAMSATAIRFNVPPNGKKCLKKGFHKNVIVVIEYELGEAPGMTCTVSVTDTRDHTLYNRERFSETKGKLAFTADEYGIFEVCITSHAPPGQKCGNREVMLQIKHGVEAKNYSDVAKADHLKPLGIELRRWVLLSNLNISD